MHKTEIVSLIEVSKYFWCLRYVNYSFFALLTVHLSIFILVINQLYEPIFLFCNKFVSCLYMFRAPCAYHQEVKIV